MAEYIERERLRGMLKDHYYPTDQEHEYDRQWAVGFNAGLDKALHKLHYAPAADVVEVVSGYHIGDVCIYGFGGENKSRAVVEIVKILNDERGVAEVKFLKVFVDDTGNGLFNYLLKSGKTMNASFQYLKNITPRMEGDKDAV